jgi:hypothetical protein
MAAASGLMRMPSRRRELERGLAILGLWDRRMKKQENVLLDSSAKHADG